MSRTRTPKPDATTNGSATAPVPVEWQADLNAIPIRRFTERRFTEVVVDITQTIGPRSHLFDNSRDLVWWIHGLAMEFEAEFRKRHGDGPADDYLGEVEKFTEDSIEKQVMADSDATAYAEEVRYLEQSQADRPFIHSGVISLARLNGITPKQLVYLEAGRLSIKDRDEKKKEEDAPAAGQAELRPPAARTFAMAYTGAVSGFSRIGDGALTVNVRLDDAPPSKHNIAIGNPVWMRVEDEPVATTTPTGGAS